MFDLSFRYGVSSFLHSDTYCPHVVLRVRLVELSVRIAVSRSRLVCFVILSVVWFVGSPLPPVVLLTSSTDHWSRLFRRLPFRSFVMAFHRFDVAFHRFDSSTHRDYTSIYVTWSATWFPTLIYEVFIYSLLCANRASYVRA